MNRRRAGTIRRSSRQKVALAAIKCDRTLAQLVAAPLEAA